MEFRLRILGVMEFLQNNNHQAVKKMKCIKNRKNTVKNRWDIYKLGKHICRTNLLL